MGEEREAFQRGVFIPCRCTGRNTHEHTPKRLGDPRGI